mgnify:CR=1 FL=1
MLCRCLLIWLLPLLPGLTPELLGVRLETLRLPSTHCRKMENMLPSGAVVIAGL